jgi:hypothetical protein
VLLLARDHEIEDPTIREQLLPARVPADVRRDTDLRRSVSAKR